MSVASQKSVPCNADFIRGKVKNRLEPGEEIMGNATVMSHCSLLRNPLPKPAGVLEHSLDEKTNCVSLIFGAIPSDPIHKVAKEFNVRKFHRCKNSCK